MVLVCIAFHIFSYYIAVLQDLIFLIFHLFPVGKNPPMIDPWIELSLNNCLCLASYWSMSSVFASLSAHMPSLCLSFTGGDEAFCTGGGTGGWSPLHGVRGGVHAFCAACLVILSRHLSTSKLSSSDVLAHLSYLTVWILFWYICASAVENVSQFIVLI